MQSKPDTLLTFDLIDHLCDPAYVLDAQANLLFASRAFFDILGMADYSLKQGETLKDILETSMRLGVVERRCMENILQVSVNKNCDENPSVRLLLINNNQHNPEQSTEFTKAQYKIKNTPVLEGCTYYRYEHNEDNSQMMQTLQRVMHINKTGFYKYDFVQRSYFFCDHLLSWFSRQERQSMQKGGLLALMSGETQKTIKQTIRDTLTQQSQNMELKETIDLHKKGPAVFKLNIDIDYDMSGNPLCALAIVQDVTVQESIKASLRKQKSVADKNAQFRANQIANMSHELRTPIGGIVGMTDVLLGESHSEKTMEKIKVIKQSSDLLMHTLTETLDHCKLMADGIKLNPSPVSPEDLLKSTCLLWGDKASQNGTTVSYSLSPDLPQFISIDEFRIKQCLNNLLSNSVKFTKDGQIEIIMQKHINNRGNTRLVIMVRDSGIGMTAEQQNNIFKPFAQADENIERRFGGTGLGMCITQKIIETMKGRMMVKSQKDIGTTIGLTLPLASATKPAQLMVEENYSNLKNTAGTPLNTQTKTRRESILIVDDIPTNRVVLEYLLCDIFPNLVFAENGQEAIDTLNNKHIDIVLMDIHMPILNGIDATKAIRSSNTPYKEIPIIIVTADEKYHKRISQPAAGFDYVIAKPINRTILFDLIDKALAKPRIREENVKPLFA